MALDSSAGREKKKWEDHLFSFFLVPVEIPGVEHPESHCPGLQPVGGVCGLTSSLALSL